MWLFIGILIGAPIGFAICALLNAGRYSNDDLPPNNNDSGESDNARK